MGISLALGLLAGYFDSNVEHVPVTILLILVCGFLLGAAEPVGVWRWALALGAGVFVFHFLEIVVGAKPRYPAEPNIFVTLFGLIPAFVGAHGGALLGRMLKQAR